MSSVEPSLSPTVDPQLASVLGKKDMDQSLMMSLASKDPSTPVIVLVFNSRNEYPDVDYMCTSLQLRACVHSLTRAHLCNCAHVFHSLTAFRTTISAQLRT